MTPSASKSSWASASSLPVARVRLRTLLTLCIHLVFSSSSHHLQIRVVKDAELWDVLEAPAQVAGPGF